MTYGAYVGIPNFRHSEPYMFLKNIKDVVNEEHNIAISWTKAAARGFIAGSIIGYTYFVGAPAGQFELSKLMANYGNRAYSGRWTR